jgi:ribosome-binding protein aMBF1 (putative translation factor)
MIVMMMFVDWIGKGDLSCTPSRGKTRATGENTCSHFGIKRFCWENPSTDKTVYSTQSNIFREHVRILRERAHMTQRDLAAALKREHGMVARIELGERRVDFVEAFWLFKALGADPEKETAMLMGKFAAAEKSRK